MKDTAFTKYHLELGAKMTSFAGFNMPVEYSGIVDEHITVREKAGVFDISHMGEFWVKGQHALAFLQYVTSNDVAALSPGKIQYSCFPNAQGGIVDDLLVYCFDSRTYMLVVNAGNIRKDWLHLSGYAGRFGLVEGRDLYDASSEIAILAVQGPRAIDTVQKIAQETVTDIPYYSFRKACLAGISDAVLSVTGYTGAGGVEIYIDNSDAPRLWEAVFEAGKEFGIKPAGLGARDTLRLEMGFCLYGNDISDETSPLEAGLGRIVKFDDSKDFLGKDRLLKQKSEGIKKKLVCFDMIDRGVPRQHYEICDREGNKIGEVTSGTVSPVRRTGIGMGYVSIGYAKPDTEIFVKIRGRLLKAKTAKRI